MNTVRTFGPALFNNDWNYHWVSIDLELKILEIKINLFQIYWAGPTLGAFVGSLFYKTVFDPSTKEEKKLEDILEDVPLNEKCERTNSA